ncbi:MAG: MerR family transcriptional regulator [Firmicutes bacterium]|nr:MerR family transcriptional regulator [Bacillota bacterium]
MNYSIGDFSAITGISIYTLRYYEKESLIVPARKENGRRSYAESDIAWIQFIKRLKDTGMPIREIQKYAKLRSQGVTTMADRMEILASHRAVLKEEIEKLEEHLSNLDDKIIYYRTEIRKQNITYDTLKKYRV